MQTPAPDKFQACPGCGYSSARVDGGAKGYLIIDSQLPDLMNRYLEMQRREDSHLIVIDRRVGHNPIAGSERRR